jgi:hypothetical protein
VLLKVLVVAIVVAALALCSGLLEVGELIRRLFGQ